MKVLKRGQIKKVSKGGYIPLHLGQLENIQKGNSIPLSLDNTENVQKRGYSVLYLVQIVKVLSGSEGRLCPAVPRSDREGSEWRISPATPRTDTEFSKGRLGPLCLHKKENVLKRGFITLSPGQIEKILKGT